MAHEIQDPQLLKLAPDLEFDAPPCPFCGRITDTEDALYHCESCDTWWDENGQFSERADSDAPQCEAEDTITSCGITRTYRCILTDGHNIGDHRGYRIDVPTGQTHAWPRVKT